MEPYVMNLRNPWDGQMKYELEDPAPHQVFFYNEAIEELAEELGYEPEDNELIPDGGSRTKYYWSGQDGILYHTEKGEDIVVPFFNTEEDAGDFIERQAELHGKDRYEGMVLRKTGDRKVAEAKDFIYNDSQLTDFMTDGGYDNSLLDLAESAGELEW
ncbi:hypothetical protein SAMN05443574_103306 [Haloarcula vallismortis]|uniref:Uncharacterized protein n=2 Tax=Haloarcula vallismortis TaxID=28442 RepID=M0JRI6_HALVA|nr:hypothetical protein [Haloarcula vallismortis]EMA11571.1 hypothetical protein C437_01625 [Haloarcula vallismortis ATCC 29715]SDW45177.1 hypothetical protein SAMN05443574_103306 [Haloarcula vallismortis]